MDKTIIPIPITDIIYDGLNFETPFQSDLSTAKHSVIVSCPKVRIGKQSQISDRLVDLVANGIEVILYTICHLVTNVSTSYILAIVYLWFMQTDLVYTV